MSRGCHLLRLRFVLHDLIDFVILYMSYYNPRKTRNNGVSISIYTT